MRIKFLKNCFAPANSIIARLCGDERQGKQETFFAAGEEYDPNEYGNEIDLSSLTYRIDYDIIAYP